MQYEVRAWKTPAGGAVEAFSEREMCEKGKWSNIRVGKEGVWMECCFAHYPVLLCANFKSSLLLVLLFPAQPQTHIHCISLKCSWDSSILQPTHYHMDVHPYSPHTTSPCS